MSATEATIDRALAPIPATPAAPKNDTAAACPYCAVLLDPAPERGRLCPRCRRPIVVRRVNGRRVLLTKEALDVFEAERGRESREHVLVSERRRWLALARGVSAPAQRVAKLEAALPSDAAVAASKDLFMSAAEQAARSARREKHWREVARIRREQAAALYREAGSPIPPPDDVVALHRAWSEAALNSLAGFGPQVELVSSGCCHVCQQDDGRVFRIAAELKVERLPHVGCPKGLCACDWWPLPGSKAKAKAKSARPRAASSAGSSSATPADPAGPAEPADVPGAAAS